MAWPNAKAWTEDDIDQLRRLWAEDKSAAQIAREMDRTRSAILGAVHRLQLSKRDPHTQRRLPSTDAMIELVAEKSLRVEVAAKKAGASDQVADRTFRAFRQRYDFGIPARIDDDMVRGPVKPLRPIEEIDAELEARR
jgi:hypothetical protein